MCWLQSEKLAPDASLGTLTGPQKSPVQQLRDIPRLGWTATLILRQEVKADVCFEQPTPTLSEDLQSASAHPLLPAGCLRTHPWAMVHKTQEKRPQPTITVGGQLEPRCVQPSGWNRPAQRRQVSLSAIHHCCMGNVWDSPFPPFLPPQWFMPATPRRHQPQCSPLPCTGRPTAAPAPGVFLTKLSFKLCSSLWFRATASVQKLLDPKWL